ncbi:MAG TPA: metalloregulator ArsR/SmtB family transcription factor [Vicinamibacterales bacterium]|nr:metalloregulator ArsR/SmtB family transcription factor [Vicinamibacterales bacterium]
MIAPSRELQTLKAEFFQALAHPIRIRLLEVLSATGEQNVQALQQRLGIEQPIVSQQLARLRANGIVVSRKEGTTVTYDLADPMIADLLAVAKEILNRRLVGAQALLHELRRESDARGRRR